MIYDANGNPYRQDRPIGFHGHDQIEADVRAEVKPERAYLPDWVASEGNDDPVGARKRA